MTFPEKNYYNLIHELFIFSQIFLNSYSLNLEFIPVIIIDS